MHQQLFLSDRSVVSVTGADAASFLNGILTASTIGLEPDAYRYGALLTPQGKVIADMLLTRREDAIILDVASIAAPALMKRLTLMKLRAAVTLAERADLGVFAFAGAPDPRDARAPHRAIGSRGAAADTAPYHAARIAAGLPEQGADFGLEEVFPADINMDLLGGIDFRKGCFVGQEVASRMKRRGTARRRTLPATVPAGLDAPGPITADGFEIGMLTSFSGGAGLARVRIDRAAEAQAAGQALLVNGHAISLGAPDWLAGELAALNEGKDARAP
jgi:folate-binding protein YgfZ